MKRTWTKALGRVCFATNVRHKYQRAAQIVEAAVLYEHGVTHDLLAWCVMPNHAHVLVHVWRRPMAKLLQSWKPFSAGEINDCLRRPGQLWEPEYWDTFMRDEEQEKKAIR